jgi:predicted nucleic acid-binding Zn ribbon protein
MSFRTNNIECTGCDFFEYEVFYRTSEGPPDCPECGSKRKMSFKGFTCAIKGQGYGSFVPVDFGVLGKAETKEDYDRCVATIEKRFPGKKVQLEYESDSKRSDRIDTIRQGSWQRKKDRGVDNQMLNEISDEQKRYKAEGRTKKKAEPVAAGSK